MRRINRKKILIEVFLITIFILFSIVFFLFYWYGTLIEKYDGYVYPNIYIENKDISKLKIKDLDKEIDIINDEYINKEIKFKNDDQEYTFYVKDLGVNINKEKLKKEINSYINTSSFIDRVIRASGTSKKVFKYEVSYNEEVMDGFLFNLKSSIDTDGSDGTLIIDDNRNIAYRKAYSSFNMDIKKSKTNVINSFKNNFKDEEIILEGESIKHHDNDTLKLIDTKTSSFSTKYNRYITRGRNLEAGLNYLDGTIIYPGEVFSFFKIAGPYNKKGYVLYDNMVGNGVCQIASTIYNTALYGGLKIVERYPHDHYLPYVPGGQDATVSSSDNYSLADFKFKNTYNYPIYISAYYNNGVATVDFWSNHDAKEGYEYYVESVRTGYNRYITYLHKTKDGEEIDKSFIASTYYYK